MTESRLTRLFRPRFTVRRLMVFMVVMSLVLALVANGQRLRRRGVFHEAQAEKSLEPIAAGQANSPGRVYVSQPGQPRAPKTYKMTPLAQQHVQKSIEYNDASLKMHLLAAALLIFSFIVVVVEATVTSLRRKA